MKRICVIILCVLAVPASVLATFYWHTTILEYRYVVGFKVVETPKPGATVVRISGLSGHSALSVRKITTEQKGASLVVLVHLFLGRKGTTGNFDYDVIVPDSVSEVRFGKQQVVIWKREPLEAGSNELPPKEMSSELRLGAL